MTKIPFPIENQPEGHALSLWKGLRNHMEYFSHLGNGFGFSSTMKWYPNANIGVAMLTNKNPSNI
jgi:hypothetical protein